MKLNISKISPTIYNRVCNMSSFYEHQLVVFTNNKDDAQKFFNQNNINFKLYYINDCFFIKIKNNLLSLLSNQSFVNYIYDNTLVKASRIEHASMNLTSLTENKYFGQGQTICFIDTGLYPHVDFIFPKSRVLKFIDLTSTSKYQYDDNGHGTFVTGIACGNGILDIEKQGFATKSNIVAIKALDANGSSNSNLILDAMEWVYNNYKKYKISIVCMSFGADVLEESNPLCLGAEALWKAGLTVVAAAGNSGPDKKTIKSPGNSPYIITVGALDLNSLSIPSFSSCGPTLYGHKPDLVAPGVNIVSCSHLGNYLTMSGTSVATPIVAGICAIIKSKYPNATNEDIKKFLTSNCKKITGDIDREGAGYLFFT